MTIQIVYDPVNGEAIPDGEVMKRVQLWAKTEGVIITTSSLLAVLNLFKKLEADTSLSEVENIVQMFFKPATGTELIQINPGHTESELPEEFRQYLDQILSF